MPRFYASATPRVERALAARGYEPVPAPTGEFLKAGGSVKCLVLTLDAFGGG